MAGAATLSVGEGKKFSRIEAALAAAKEGDTVEVHRLPGNRAYEKVALMVRAPGVSIQAVGGQRIPLDGKGFDYSGRGSVPRAIVQFNKGADGSSITGFELRGAHNESHNGAGVRINQANDVSVRHCTIHGNDMGIMSNGDGTPRFATGQLIEGCLIHSNGDHSHPGYNHNLYLGGSDVTMRGCEVHSSLTGHNYKSRAHRNVVIGCYIHDSANREFDLVDGKGDTDRPASDSILAGNVIVKDPRCRGNKAVIHFGQDGGKGHDGTLYLVHNTIVTPFISPVVDLSTPKARLNLLNNIIGSGGVKQQGQTLLSDRTKSGGGAPVSGAVNWLAAGFQAKAAGFPLKGLEFGESGERPPFVDAAKGDFRLGSADPGFVDKGSPVPEGLMEAIGGKLPEFSVSEYSVARPVAGKPDLGAYEHASN